MRLKLMQIVTVLLIAGSSDARPQKIEVANVQPKIEAESTEGWRPVQHEANVAQDSIPVGKDLPQIVEGNSRYTEGGRSSRRKSYVINNLFYKHHNSVVDKFSNESNEQVDIEAFESRVFDDDHIIQSKEDAGRKSISILSVVENPRENGRLFGNDDFSGTEKLANPATIQREKLNSDSRGKSESGQLSLENLTNFDYLLNIAPSISTSLKNRTSEIMSQRRIGDLENVRPEIISHSRVISSGYKPTHVKQEKVRSFDKILSVRDGSKNLTNKTTISESKHRNLHSIRNQVFRPELVNSKNEVEHSISNSSNLVTASQRVANQIRKRFEKTDRTKNVARIKSQGNSSPPRSIVKGEHHKATVKKNGNNDPKNSLKANSNQSIPNQNFKNWPNGNLQNTEDLYNYEKYTSFHIEDENLGEQADKNYSVSHEHSGNVHKITKRPIKSPRPNESTLIPDSPLLPNVEADVTNIYDPESHLSLEQIPQDSTRWEQIQPAVSNKSDFLVTDIHEAAELNGFDSIPEGLDPNRPLNAEHEETQGNNHYEYIDGSLIGEYPALQIAQNYNQEYPESQNLQSNFENPYLQAHVTAGPAGETLNEHQNGVVYTPELSQQSYFNPTSVVSQNTVVHILNASKKQPNVTVTEMKVPLEISGSSLNPGDTSVGSNNSSSSAPNVHIMFTTQEDKNEELGDLKYGLTVNQQKPEVTYDDSLNCPTITINSYTRINNTVQGKEGCTDLNIIINSHVLNTNVFNPSAQTSTGNHKTGNKIPSERYPGNIQAEPSYAISDGGYGTFSTQSGQNNGGSLPSDFQDIPVSGGEPFQGDIQSPGTSFFEVFQQTQINVESQNDVQIAEDALDTGVPNDSLNDDPGVEASEPSNPAGIPQTVVSNDPVSLAEVADDAGPTGVADDPPIEAIQAPAADSPASPGNGGLQLPGIINPLSGITNQLSNAVGNLGSQNGQSGTNTGSGLPGSILGDDDDDDDDDDDMMELLPFSMLESVSSMLPYFTLFNPLNYGLLSLALSPLAVVAAAGIFGIAAIFLPFALRGAFNFGRASNEVTIKVKPSIEEMVKESIRRYGNWVEWKSKRKKRKR